jgi:hypothetical protein
LQYHNYYTLLNPLFVNNTFAASGDKRDSAEPYVNLPNVIIPHNTFGVRSLKRSKRIISSPRARIYSISDFVVFLALLFHAICAVRDRGSVLMH